MCKRDAPMCVGTGLWPLKRDDSSRGLVGAAGTWRSDWRRPDVGALIGQSACRLLALARVAIDSTRAGASGSLHSAATILLNPMSRSSSTKHSGSCCFFLIHFPSSINRLWPSCHLVLGGLRHLQAN